MKKTISLLMIMVILTGCSSKDEDVEKNVDDILETGTASDSAAIDIHLNENISSYDTPRINYCETKYGFYASIMGEVIYMDKETGKRMVVCGKPNCNHNKMRYDEEALEAGKVQCDGYVWNNNQVCVYNGKILLDRTDDNNEYSQIIKEDVDGSNKEVLIKDMFPEDRNGGDSYSTSYSWRLYNDNIYIFTSETYYKDREKFLRICLEKFDAKTGERQERIFEKTYNDGAEVASGGYIWIFGETMYIQVMTEIDIGDGHTYTEDGARICMNKMLKVNLSTGEAEFEQFMDDYDLNAGEARIDNKIVYLSTDNKLKMVNTETKEECFAVPVEELTSIGDSVHCVDSLGKYIIIRIDKEYSQDGNKYASKLMFYDMDGKFVDEVYMEDSYHPQLVNENMMMLTSGPQGFAYINTEEIGTGEINIREFEK